MVLNGGKVSLEVQHDGSLEMKVWDGGKEWNGLNVMGFVSIKPKDGEIATMQAYITISCDTFESCF